MIPVMIVDDEPIVKMALRYSIPWEENGYTLCATASGGQEALEAYRRLKPQIVITDLRMPGMDGLELIKRLREEGFTGVLLVLSNYDDFDSVRTALVLGADDYLLKVSIDASTLLGQIEKARARLDEREESAPEAPSPQAWSQAAADALLRGAPAPDGLCFPCDFAFLSFFTDRQFDARLLVSNVLDTMQEYPSARLVQLGERVLAVIDGTSALISKLDARCETYQSLHATVRLAPRVGGLQEARALCTEALAYAQCFHPEHEEVTRVIRHIDKNLAAKAPLEALAQQVNLSVSYLCRIFKQDTGRSINQYISERRMSRAVELLTGTRMPVKSVALTVGFDDQMYFSRLFHKTYRMTPSAYRARERHEQSKLGTNPSNRSE